MPDYSLSVALFDFLPVMVAAAGLFWLARGIAETQPGLALIAWSGAMLVPLGGLCKASWKLAVALGWGDFEWLENMLFISMAPGFLILSYCLYQVRRARGPAAQHALRLGGWLALVLGGAALSAAAWPDSRGWFFWLLATTTLSNAALLLNAVLCSRKLGLPSIIAISFAFNFIATLALSGLARLPDTELTAWIQESVNLLAQSALAFGFYHLGAQLRGRPTLQTRFA